MFVNRRMRALYYNLRVSLPTLHEYVNIYSDTFQQSIAGLPIQSKACRTERLGGNKQSVKTEAMLAVHTHTSIAHKEAHQMLTAMVISSATLKIVIRSTGLNTLIMT